MFRPNLGRRRSRSANHDRRMKILEKRKKEKKKKSKKQENENERLHERLQEGIGVTTVKPFVQRSHICDVLWWRQCSFPWARCQATAPWRAALRCVLPTAHLAKESSKKQTFSSHSFLPPVFLDMIADSVRNACSKLLLFSKNVHASKLI